MASVIKAREDQDAMRADACQASGSAKDPVVVLLEKTCTAVHTQANLAIDAFLDKIKSALKKYVLQGPLIANALSTTMQYQMSIWWMIGGECIRPLCAKHPDWCGLVGVIQALVKTILNNHVPRPFSTT